MEGDFDRSSQYNSSKFSSDDNDDETLDDKEIDISPNKDGKLMKLILKKGKGMM